VLPAWPFYGGRPINPDTTARATIREFLDEANNEETERALGLAEAFRCRAER